MNVEKINKTGQKRRILVAPLDWGLGHATRCIPIIALLLEQGATVFIAAETAVAELLQKEFPGIVILRLKGYKINYSRGKGFFLLKMLLQLPKIMASISAEHKWLKAIISKHHINGLIADNRFGLYTKKIPAVFITHQLFIETGSKLLNKLAQKINYKYINKFSECWVPDAGGAINLAGALAHPKKLPAIPVKYLGILSRFKKKELQKDIDLLILISGPEPQRSIFEKILLKETADAPGTIILLRGLPVEPKKITAANKNIQIINHLPANELNELILRSKLVIARAGYSTIMDLAALQQSAMLVATPGQTEQEYLARYLKEKKIFFTVKQQSFSLKREIENLKNFQFANTNISSKINQAVIFEWLEKLGAVES